jgi:hypothetical protein
MLARRAAAVAAIAVGCGAAGSSPPPERASAAGPGPSAARGHDAAWVTRTCTAEYRQEEANWATYMPREKATSPFAHCPRWRMAAPSACGAEVQPSYLDPCHCMCDLCESDADCGAGSSCVSMASVMCGGLAERVCVKKTDACHPGNAPTRCPTYCVTLFGSPRCVSKADLAVCRR